MCAMHPPLKVKNALVVLDVTAVDTLKLNSDRKQSTTFSESGAFFICAHFFAFLREN